MSSHFNKYNWVSEKFYLEINVDKCHNSVFSFHHPAVSVKEEMSVSRLILRQRVQICTWPLLHNSFQGNRHWFPTMHFYQRKRQVAACQNTVIVAWERAISTIIFKILLFPVIQHPFGFSPLCIEIAKHDSSLKVTQDAPHNVTASRKGFAKPRCAVWQLPDSAAESPSRLSQQRVLLMRTSCTLVLLGSRQPRN